MTKNIKYYVFLFCLLLGLPIQAEEIVMNWAFNQGDNSALQGTVSQDGLLSYANAQLGSDLSFAGTQKVDNNKITTTKIQPTVKATTNSDGNAIIFAVKPKKGLTLTAKTFSFDACKVGTSGGTIDVVAFVGDANYTLQTSLSPNRAYEYSHYDIDLSQVPASGEELLIKVYIKSLATDKQHGFANFTISATTEGTVIPVNSYTVSTSVSDDKAGAVSLIPASGVYDEGTQVTVTAAENFGYHFAQWVDDNGTP